MISPMRNQSVTLAIFAPVSNPLSPKNGVDTPNSDGQPSQVVAAQSIETYSTDSPLPTLNPKVSGSEAGVVVSGSSDVHLSWQSNLQATERDCQDRDSPKAISRSSYIELAQVAALAGVEVAELPALVQCRHR
jgi:hypothetical protein